MDVPENCSLIKTEFVAGPLGITLKRHNEREFIYVLDLVKGSQAEGKDICSKDRLWSVGAVVLGTTPVNKDSWTILLQYIKESPRPLEIVFCRLLLPPKASSVVKEEIPEVLTGDPKLRELVGKITIKSRTQERKASLDPKLWVQSAVTSSKTKADLEESRIDAVRKDLLSKEDRKVIMSGEVELVGSCLSTGASTHTNNLLTIFNGSSTGAGNKRILYLLSDLLLVTIPNGKEGQESLLLEHSIELSACKLDDYSCHWRKDHTGNLAVGATSPVSQLLDLISPDDPFCFLFASDTVKDEWKTAFFRAITSSVEHVFGTEFPLGWKHQVIVGTMHAAVISRDEGLVFDLLQACDAGDLNFSDIEMVDEEGYTPLHYACMFRLRGIISLLHEHSTDVTVADYHGWTPIHWAALQLDAVTLKELCSHIFDVDILDNKGRTPLFLVCVEGRAVTGKADMAGVCACVEVLLAAEANIIFRDMSGRNLLHYLASSWECDPLKIILEHENAKGLVFEQDLVSAWTALHYAVSCRCLKKAEGAGRKVMKSFSSYKDGIRCMEADDSDDDNEYGNREAELYKSELWNAVRTVDYLIQAGARLNVKDNNGRSSLMVLNDCFDDWVSKHIEKQLDEANQHDESESLGTSEFQNVLCSLLSSGARLTHGPHTSEEAVAALWKSLEGKCSDPEGPSKLTSMKEMWAKKAPLQSADCNAKLEGDCFLQFAPEVIEVAATTPAVDTRGSISPKQPATVPSPCFLCSTPFSMFRRQHHCRLCSALCCDDCSKKLVVVVNGGSQVRACDGCYNRGCRVVQAEKEREMLASMKPLTADNRKELFKGTTTKDGTTPLNQTSSSTSELTAKMAETHDRLVERGEKLDQLQDKSAALNDASSEFAKMAKQLRDQQKNSWF